MSKVSSKIKRNVSATTAKVKDKVVSAVSTVKVKTSDYKSALEQAYNAGYQNGWVDSENLPNVKGARTAATVGYGRGIKSRMRYNKSQRRLNDSRVKSRHNTKLKHKK